MLVDKQSITSKHVIAFFYHITKLGIFNLAVAAMMLVIAFVLNMQAIVAEYELDGKPAGEGTGCTVSDECDSLFYVPFEKVTSENVNDYAK